LDISSGYAITVVRGRMDAALVAQLTEFWRRNGAIVDPRAARRRCAEVVCVARNGAGEIAGINSAAIADFSTAGDRHYFYRQFIRAQDRSVRLSTALVRAGVAALRAHARSAAVKGVVLVAENPKFARRGARRILERLGWRYLGKGPRGFDVWRIAFSEPPAT